MHFNKYFYLVSWCNLRNCLLMDDIYLVSRRDLLPYINILNTIFPNFCLPLKSTKYLNIGNWCCNHDCNFVPICRTTSHLKSWKVTYLNVPRFHLTYHYLWLKCYHKYFYFQILNLYTSEIPANQHQPTSKFAVFLEYEKLT